MVKKNGAQALIQSMINQNIKYVFGIPGAKIDKFFNELKNCTNTRKPKLIVTRHEQNASFIASGIGRLTGQPGVVVTTSGPGVSNLATGLITATSEGDPVIALGGQVPRNDVSRLTHQSIPNKELLQPATKSSYEVQDANNISEVFANAYQNAVSPKAGGTFVSLPQDILSNSVSMPEIKKFNNLAQSSIDNDTLQKVINKIKDAKLPVILAGMRASSDDVTNSIHNLLRHFSLPVVETFQGAGVISHQFEDDYFGRVGLFRNQIGDNILKKSDLVITVGYDPVEYEARNWNIDDQRKIINIDDHMPEITNDYQPDINVNANISNTIDKISNNLPKHISLSKDMLDDINILRAKFDQDVTAPKITEGHGFNPIDIINTLQKNVSDDTTVTVDMGSHYIWMARYFRSYKPRHLLFTNGMQTLGVSLPWAIATSLVRPYKPVVSVSGDGGFLFSGQELETAVRLNANITQLIWEDGYYDMVKFQEEIKYGQNSGVQFGKVDFVKYAESFGATGIKIHNISEFDQAMKKATKINGPVIIVMAVNYSANTQLKTNLLKDSIN